MLVPPGIPETMSLLVTVQLHPGGDRHRAKTLGTVEIANVSELEAIADYRVAALFEGPVVQARVTGHRRSDGWQVLLRRALEALGFGDPASAVEMATEDGIARGKQLARRQIAEELERAGFASAATHLRG